MAEEIKVLTQEGYDKLVAEHEELTTVRRKEVAERLKEAISYGDLSENAEYDAAKNEQAEMEERIRKLEAQMRNATIINADEIDQDRVNIGLRVLVRNEEKQKEEEFDIVGSNEADPFVSPAKIANDSPIGEGLIGHRAGERVSVEVPKGTVEYTILSITKVEK